MYNVLSVYSVYSMYSVYSVNSVYSVCIVCIVCTVLRVLTVCMRNVLKTPGSPVQTGATTKRPKELLLMLSIVSQKSKVRLNSKYYDRYKPIGQNVFD